MFRCQHLLFGAAGPAALLATDARGLLSARAGFSEPLVFDLGGQELSRGEAVRPLGAKSLALHGCASWPMHEDHAGGDLVHVLPPLSAGVDEAFLEVAFPDAERRQPLRQRARLRTFESHEANVAERVSAGIAWRFRWWE